MTGAPSKGRAASITSLRLYDPPRSDPVMSKRVGWVIVVSIRFFVSVSFFPASGRVVLAVRAEARSAVRVDRARR